MSNAREVELTSLAQAIRQTRQGHDGNKLRGNLNFWLRSVLTNSKTSSISETAGHEPLNFDWTLMDSWQSWLTFSAILSVSSFVSRSSRWDLMVGPMSLPWRDNLSIRRFFSYLLQLESQSFCCSTSLYSTMPLSPGLTLRWKDCYQVNSSLSHGKSQRDHWALPRGSAVCMKMRSFFHQPWRTVVLWAVFLNWCFFSFLFITT